MRHRSGIVSPGLTPDKRQRLEPGAAASTIRGVSKKAGKKKTSGAGGSSIAVNKRARHDYFIEETYEAGLSLQGWEVKSLRDGRVNLQEAYVLVRHGEGYLVGCNIPPLQTASTHVSADPTRTRKLLLHRRELGRLIGATEQKGHTLVPLNMHWKRGVAKVDIGLARGKKQYDKREDAKQRDWQREKARLLKHKV